MLYRLFPYKTMDHHQILLYGFHFSFLFIFTLAVIRDLIFNNLFNATINFSGFLLTLISYALLHFRNKTTLASYMIILIAILPLSILIYVNHFGNLVIIYVMLIPLAVFFMLPFRQAVFVNIFIFILLIGMLYHLSTIQPDAPILNNPKALINIAFVSILTMLFGVFYHLSIETQMKKLQHSNRQKDILLQEVHHRVKNNLNMTASMLGLQALHIPQTAKIYILKSKTRIESIAAVHEMLYRQESLDKILFYDYLMRLEKLLSKTYSGKERYKFIVQVDQTIAFPIDTMVQFGLMLNEMIVNSLKYAKTPQQLTITISLYHDKEGYLFGYQDNGINPKSRHQIEQSTGLGSKLIQLSAKQIGGKLTISYHQGLIYHLRFKNV